MHVFYSRQDTLRKALLTERVQLYITGTNLLPSRAVAFILFVLPAVTLVLLIGFCFMGIKNAILRYLDIYKNAILSFCIEKAADQFLLLIHGSDFIYSFTLLFYHITHC